MTNQRSGGTSPQKRSSQRLAEPRIAPVKKEDWSPEQRQLLEPFEKAGRLYNVFTTLANHAKLAGDWMTFATHVLRDNSLPPRDRELLILRAGWRCHAEYEWGHHVRLGKSAGLTDDDLRRIQDGPHAQDLSDHDRLLLTAVDELHDDTLIRDDTWQALTRTYNTQQMIDLVFTVGQYHLVSMALNSFGVQLEDDFQGFSA